MRLPQRLKFTTALAFVKRYFVTGLLVWIPLATTIMLLVWIVGLLDHILLLLPDSIRPEKTIGVKIPGLGLVLGAFIVLLTGIVTANVLGQKLLGLWEKVLGHIPVVKSIYYSVKQVSDSLLSGSGQAFRKALLIEYPRKGIWTIGFLTGKPGGDVVNYLEGDYVSVYMPTTPNPTSGFFLMLPKSDVRELDMSVDEALKYIISMGVVVPPVHPVVVITEKQPD